MRCSAVLCCMVLFLGCGDDSVPPTDIGGDVALDGGTVDGAADTTTVTPDSTIPGDAIVPDGPQADGPQPDGALPLDGAVPDSTVVTPDQAVVTPDQAVVTPDQAVVTPDQAVVTPDQALQPDAAVPDSTVITPDQALQPDSSVPDSTVITPDQALQPDSAVPDSTVISPDQAVAPVCGNGTREGTEECDDGNTTNLDGCDSVCMFEQDHRANYLLMQFGTDSFCTKNAFGSAFGGLAQGQVQSTLDDGIADGSISILFKFLGLDDLSGTNDSAVKLGVMAGAPATGSGYDGTADKDWWYDVDTSTIDSNRDPLAALDGQITSGVLTAGPGDISVVLDLGGGSPATLSMSSAKITVDVGNSDTPLTSTGNPPGHLAAEQLDPTLTSFHSMGAKTSGGAGELCGNASAASLHAVPMPSSLVGGLFGCSGYSASNNNTMLDLLISGCTVWGNTVISKVQPDSEDPSVPPAGAGPPYTLTANSNTKKITGCQDKNNQPVNLQACLADAAYSTFLKFATGRVILK